VSGGSIERPATGAPGGLLTEAEGAPVEIDEPVPAPAPEPVPAGAVPQPPAIVPVAPQGPIDVIGSVVNDAVANVGLILRPEAAIAVATEFTFPLVLALAVLLFIVVQHQVDRRDPKLRAAPQHAAETLIRFETEEQL
jgi:hypothetical protein